MAGDQPALDVPKHVLDYLGAQKTLTLATASPAGVPKATTLTYVNDGVAMYVWTRPETTTARHIEQNPLVSFAIDEYTDDWRQTKGIQGTGDAQVVLSPTEVNRALELFRNKFSDVGDTTASNISFFRVTPTEIRFIDNTAGAKGEPQAVGIEYPSDIAYSVFRDLPQEAVSTVVASMQTMEVEPGDRDRAAGRARGQVLHPRRRRGRGHPRGRGPAADARAPEPGAVLRRDGDPPRHAARGDGAGRRADDAVRDGPERVPGRSSRSRSGRRRTSIA